jgi:acyl-homoserine lactone acylase PvdQ
MIRCIVRTLATAALTALLLAPGAAAQVQPYGTDDYRGFRNVLPPGTNGLDNLTQLGLFEAAGQRPPHSDDQLQMYSSLTNAAGGITSQTIPDYFKDATYGVAPGDVQSSESPETGVTIVRDKQYGVPHIYGDTRSALMFGIGYATAEDRLFFIDALRHAGQGDLAAFAGGANVAMDQSVWESEPYTQQDLANQVNYGIAHGPDGQQILADASSYVNGINAYIDKAKQPLNTLTMMPAEYTALGMAQGPAPFTLQNLVSIATLVGGIFGNGGGDQLSNAVLYQSLTQKFGRERRAVDGSPVVIAQAKRPRHKAKRHKHKAKPHKPAGKRKRGGTPKRAKPASAATRRKHRVPKKKTTHKKKKGKVVDRSGFATFESFDSPNDPEAPTTVHKTVFHYQSLPKPSQAVAKTVALPDPGSVQNVDHVVAGAAPQAHARPARTPGARRSGLGLGTLANAGPGLLAFPRDMSNALLISASDSASGHPLAVMGPQVSYFTPQILMEEDIHGPGVDADGAAFPGVNLYVELGHGDDYAWSATSSGQNIIDTFAVSLCNPGGGTVTTASNFYLLRGQCVPMETLTRQESWQPNLADSTPAGSITMQTQRTAYGIVIARARIKVRACGPLGIPPRLCGPGSNHPVPVAYTNLRSTYMHELDSAAGFEQFNDPAQMRNPQDFFKAAYKIGYTFNWFYSDDQHIAYFDSGQNPVRAKHTDPLFPTWSKYAWKGLNPSAQTTSVSLTEQQTPQNAHPHVTDQDYLTSWNNKQARGYENGATGQQFSSIYRSQLLDNNIAYYLKRDHHKLTLADLVNAMGIAGTQDLRGVEVLPYALKVIGNPSSPALANAVSELRAWVASGSHRINRAHPGAHGDYDQADAVRLMDAWWPLLVRAEFAPVLGSNLLNQVQSDFAINDQPGHGTSGEHLGSAFDVGFYGVVQKDLRSILHQRVAGPLNRIYCGSGSLVRCRAALAGSLSAAIAETPQQVYPADGVCRAGDQMCSDSIQFRAIGAVTQPLTEWVNRPTFQQSDEIQGHGPR